MIFKIDPYKQQTKKRLQKKKIKKQTGKTPPIVKKINNPCSRGCLHVALTGHLSSRKEDYIVRLRSPIENYIIKHHLTYGR